MAWLDKLLGNRKNNFTVELFGDNAEDSWKAKATVFAVKDNTISFNIASKEGKNDEFKAILKISLNNEENKEAEIKVE